MVNKVLKSFAIALVFLSITVGRPSTATTSSLAATVVPPDALNFLPTSDAILLVDVRRLLNETLPRVFASDSAKLAQVNSEIDNFKTRTGIDPRAFDRVVIGTHYTYPAANKTRLETTAIAHGTFDVKALVAAGKIATNGKYREETYRGATIMIFGINDQMRLLGLWNMKVSELALCALDAKTLAIGSVPNVRAAIEAGQRGRRENNVLASLASRDPNAVIGFGANVTRGLMANLNVGNDTIAKDANSIRQVYGSIGSGQTDVSLVLVARTDTPDAAKSLGDTVTGLKQLGTIFIARMAPAKRALAQSALDNLKISARGNELEIRTQFAAASLAAVIK